MCGITGFNWEDADLIRKLTGLLQHRGPDQEGYHVADGVSLGHKRLSIIDLSDHGRQPLYNEDGGVCVVYNGEIFNFQDLKTQLQQKGHLFRSHTDTEVLVHGYEEWGTELPEHLNGEFAFCILEKNANRLFLARDRFGIKPLYYYARDGKFMFGSELKTLMKNGVPKELDPLSLEHYLLFGNVPPNKAILKDVQQVPPGHWLVYSLRQKRLESSRPYWQMTFHQPKLTNPRDIMQELVWRLEKSVKQRLISDVPLGAFLSGGIDSSILVALMRNSVSRLKTFSIRFDYSDFNESHYAQMVSKMYETEHYEIQFNADSVKTLIEKLPYHYDELFADPSMIPTCLVSSVARRHVTVSLSGTGSDELFAGYPRYVEFGLLKKLNHLYGPARRLLDGSVGLANGVLGLDKLSKLRVFLQQNLTDTQLYMMLFSYMFRNREEPLEKLDSFLDQGQYLCCGNDIENLLNFDIHVYLPACLLVKEDRASMAVSLETRVPFLDHELAEFSARIPAHLKLHHGCKKYILKKAFAHLLPPAVLHRKKQGFGVPLVHYFRRELKEYARDIIFQPGTFQYYDKNVLETLWRRHQDGKADYSRIFWSIIMFNRWHETWIQSA